MKHLLSLQDFSSEEILGLLESAEEIKAKQKAGESHRLLDGKSLAMIFQKPSNRTRVSFDMGMFQLGGKTVDIKQEEIKMGERETIPDVSRVISRYVDGVMIRPFYHSDLVEFAEYSSVPVINGLSDLYHPCQALADMLTVKEHTGRLAGVKFCYIGDGNNVCNSLINACTALDLELTVCCPKGFEPTMETEPDAYRLEHDPKKAVQGVDVIYTDVWISMGPDEHTLQKNRKAFYGYTVSAELMKLAASDAIFMHCLPAHRGEEVTNTVIESSQSVVFDQAENRMHAQKAVLVHLMCEQ